MDRYETVDGPYIDRVMREEGGDTVLVEHDDGLDRLNFWTDSIVGGMCNVSLQDIPELTSAPIGEWVRIRRS